jgi:hypothetical protein
MFFVQELLIKCVDYEMIESAWLIESIVTVSACNMNDSPMRSDDRIWPCCAMLRWCCHFLR